jgi:ferritin-like metal-binding protein YciE
VQRLEEISQGLGETARGKRGNGMEGLVEEGMDVMEKKSEAP